MAIAAYSPEDLLNVSHYLSPYGLARKVDKKQENPAHLQLLDAKLMECINTWDGRLIISMPPRHGKSERVSRFMPAWALGCDPSRRVALASYEANFAALWGSRVRDIVDQQGEVLYGIRTRDDSSAKAAWELEKQGPDGLWTPTGGGMISVGVGGPLTGRGFDVGIIDDPIKNAQEAASKVIRAKIWEWWQSTFASRTEPGASIIIIMTRWNEDDLVGRLLKEMAENTDEDVHNWEYINLPAVATENERIEYAHATDPATKKRTCRVFERKAGDSLWPKYRNGRERYGPKWAHKKRREAGTYYWEALYQGNPQPQDQMGHFKRGWFNYADIPPQRLIRGKVRNWDLAATEKTDPTEEPDWTVGALLSYAHYNEKDEYATYVEDVVRFRDSPGGVERMILATARRDGKNVPIRIEQEPGSQGKLFIAHMKRLLRGWTVIGEPSSGNKQLRAAPVAADAEDGLVVLVTGSWVGDFLYEAERFPFGDHDDQIDAVSGGHAFLMTRFASAPAVGVKQESRVSPYYDRLE